LNSDLGSVQVVAVQFAQDLVDLALPSVGVNVDKPVVPDDVGLHDRRESGEQCLQVFVAGALGQVADEQLLRRLARPPTLTLLHFDVSAFDRGAVEGSDGLVGLIGIVHVDEGVVLDAFALADLAELLEKRPQVFRLDVPGNTEVAHIQLHPLDSLMNCEEYEVCSGH